MGFGLFVRFRQRTTPAREDVGFMRSSSLGACAVCLHSVERFPSLFGCDSIPKERALRKSTGKIGSLKKGGRTSLKRCLGVTVVAVI